MIAPIMNPYEPPKSAKTPARKEGHCSFCGHHYRAVGPLVEGPELAYICGACCDQLREQFATATSAIGETGQCGFCSKDSSLVGDLLAASSGVVICVECTGFVRSILDQEARRRARKPRGR